MLNTDVHERCTKHQYQELSKGSAASPEEGKLLKKKYVVFNFDGTIAELRASISSAEESWSW
jgi:hypothetical protein